ncbi:Dehydrogenase [Methylocella tundrae]|uniref:Dehydrogenase n=1 Tax=Methylocella tundrae TaxID=227605 RepID=A0A8B6M8B8_METTU|nr:FAD-dependent oxidoreductase [Methylocella tundrae]VTZ26529.1 Dehydrogenase [Methylocella tundrae]VTZ51130.1 Dehydrogenase [Methylocella tundrae]
MQDNERDAYDIVVVGSGIAGLSAAVTAAESGQRVGIVERAAEGEHGGNTRYTEAYLRMKSVDETADDFEYHFAENAGGYIDPSFLQEATRDYQNWSPLMRSLSMLDPEIIGSLAENAGPTLRWLERLGVKFEFLPTAFITTTTTRLLPVGGGLALVETLTAKAKEKGVAIHFNSTAQKLLTDVEGAVAGLVVQQRGKRRAVSAKAIVLACGGFEGNAEMLAQYLGPRSINLRPVARGGYYNKGEGIRMALEIGAAPNGDFGSYHAEPVDPRSDVAEPAVFTFPYGILVNKDGQRFADEAPGTVDAVYESVTRRIYEQRDGIAYLILDAKIEEVPNWKKSLRTNQSPITGGALAELADKIGLDPRTLEQTVNAYNAACRDGVYKPLELDGLATKGLEPKKSNWARPIDTPTYRCYPIISANVFTFGGLKINRHAQVLNTDGDPLPGLYAAGETAGIYYRVYTGSTSVLRGAVFGRLAAQHAAAL